MKQVLIILRGAPASGKTTIGKNLRDFHNKIVWLKVDNFKPFFSENLEEALPVVNETALVTLRYLLDQGNSVIFDGIFRNPIYVKKAMEYAKNKNIPCVFYQLSCSLKRLQERDRLREGVKEGCRKPLGDEVIEKIYNELENTKIEGAIPLDTENNSLPDYIEIIKKNFVS